ncbi:MAG: C1 family peptidase [Bacteroidales bacterium]
MIFSTPLHLRSQVALTPERLQEYSARFHDDDNWQMRMNAVTHNDINSLARNRASEEQIDKHFTYRVPSSGITNQKNTGRCWLFTGLNVVRANVISEKGLKSFELSQNYNFFYDQLEKSNLFLENIIETASLPMEDQKVDWLFRNVIGDGGQWTGVSDLIKKYGVVPSEIFPETKQSENTGQISRIVRRKLRKSALELREMYHAGKKAEEIREEKHRILAEVYAILATALGEPPATFTWRYETADGTLSPLKSYTPQSFFSEFVNVDLDDYVMFMNDPSRPLNKLYEIEYDRHQADGRNWKYINLDTERLKEFAVRSLREGEAMYFSCDVGKQLDRDLGTLNPENYDYGELFGTDLTMSKADRIRSYESASTHGMALVGVDIDESGSPRKWLLENSWGDSGFEGHLIMSDEWFDEYMFRLVVHKSFVDEDVLKILEQKPVLLPPWDPMFQSDN